MMPLTVMKMNKVNLEKIKKHYEQIRSDIIKSLSIDNGELDIEGDEVDQIQGKAIYQMSQKLSSARKDNLIKIDESLRAIYEGTLDECEVCGQQIGEKRLMAIPGVRMCIVCAEEAENHSKQFV